jgi:riboflavin synthase
MFTGIVQLTPPISAVVDHAGGRRLSLPVAAFRGVGVPPTFARTTDETVGETPTPLFTLGESIAVNGTCLTLAAIDESNLHFDVIAETLDKTNLGALRAGDAVNVERSLRVGDRIDGHFVQGHVDGVGVLSRKAASDAEWRYTIEAPEGLSKYLSPKGSICVDGVSLTIAAVKGRRFNVALIPTTLKLTTLAARDVGYNFNLECDVMAKQIVTFLEQRQPVTT